MLLQKQRNNTCRVSGKNSGLTMGNIMRMRNSNVEDAQFGHHNFSASQTVYAQKPKLSSSIEKKIERLLSQSESQGWSYGDFAIYLFEVLLVLQQRNKMKKA
jgi:hypothetical protein